MSVLLAAPTDRAEVWLRDIREDQRRRRYCARERRRVPDELRSSRSLPVRHCMGLPTDSHGETTNHHHDPRNTNRSILSQSILISTIRSRNPTKHQLTLKRLFLRLLLKIRTDGYPAPQILNQSRIRSQHNRLTRRVPHRHGGEMSPWRRQLDGWSCFSALQRSLKDCGVCCSWLPGLDSQRRSISIPAKSQDTPTGLNTAGCISSARSCGS